VYLLKETDGVKTADPKVVPTAQTIRELPYELAVEAGNIQSKAVRPAMEDGLAIKVLDPTNPTLFTTIGPFRLEDKLYLIPNTIRTRCISVDPPTNSTQVDLLEEILQNIRINETLELLELRCDASGIVLVVKEGYAAEYLERHIRQFGAEIHSHASWYLRVIGKVTNENTQAFTRLIASFRPLLYSIGRPDAMALSAVFPSDVESGDVVRQAHSLLLKRSNGIEQQ
jgi:aspartokinase